MKCEECSKIYTKNMFKKVQVNKCSTCDKNSSKPSKTNRLDLEESLVEIVELKKKLDDLRETKLKQNIDRLNQLRDEINNKANDLISSIQKKQMKLLNETKTIELNIRKKLNPNSIDAEIELKTKEAKKTLDTQVELDEYTFVQLMDDFLMLKPELDQRLAQIEKLNDDDLEFVSKISSEADATDFGEIINKKSGSPVAANSNNWGGDIINRRGSIYKRRGSFINSIYCVDKAIKIDLNFDESLLAKPKASLSALAAQKIESPTPEEPNNSEDLVNGKYWEKEIQKETLKDTTTTDDYIAKGLKLSYEKKFDEAIYNFNKEIDSNSNPDAYNYKG